MSFMASVSMLATMSAQEWADQTFGAVQLGDVRRTQRLVATAAAIAARPSVSLPQQLSSPAALKAAYRLLDSAEVAFADLMIPHQEQTRIVASSLPVVLLVQDTTELDFTAHRATTGLAPIGNGGGQGFHLQTVLAVQPEPRVPLGVLAAEPWRRQPAAVPGQSSYERTKRPRESEVWSRLAQAVGSPPAGVRWVHLADRGADCYGFFAACTGTGTDVLVRVVQNRRVTDAEGELGHLIDVLRDCPAMDSRPLSLPARPKRPARQTRVAVSWTGVTLVPPVHPPRDQPTPDLIPAWVVRVWESDPPSGSTPVEW